MKRLQEFSDVKDQYTDCVDTYIRRIEKLPLPYTGNKKKLLYRFNESLKVHDVKFKSVVDAFCGSASVAMLFKLMGKRVIANDLLTSSYMNAVAMVENPGIKLTEDEKEFLLKNPNSNKSTFVEDNYLGKDFCPEGKTTRFNKFTLAEARHLDNFRANIDELCGIQRQGLGFAANAAVIMRLPFGQVDASTDVLKHRKKQQAAYGDGKKKDRRIGIYYDDDFNLNFNKWFKQYVEDFSRGVKLSVHEEKYKRASFLMNLNQHVLRDCMVQGRLNHGQSLAEIDVRLSHPKNQLKAKISNNGSTEMDFFTRAGTNAIDCRPGEGLKWWSLGGAEFPGEGVATNMDATELFKSGVCNGIEAAYFDPPYGSQSSDYATIYRFLEEYVYSEHLENLPHIKAYANKFSSKRLYEDHFIEMLESAEMIPTWLFSYNDRSWKDIEYICDIIKQFKKNVTVDVLDEQYRYLYSKSQGRKSNRSEYLIIAR